MDYFKQLIEHRTDVQHKVMKNTTWLLVGEIGSRVLRGGLAIIAARMLGATGLGEFAYAMALGGFLTFFEEAGISIFITREFTKDTESREKLFGTALVLKLILLSIAIAFFMVVGPVMSSLPEAQTLIPVMALVLIFDSLRSFFFSVSRAEQQMHIESKNNIYTNILIVGISLAFMFVSRTALALTWGYAIGDGIGFIFMVIAVKKYITNLLKHF